MAGSTHPTEFKQLNKISFPPNWRRPANGRNLEIIATRPVLTCLNDHVRSDGALMNVDFAR
jgi:hypothetical protein